MKLMFASDIHGVAKACEEMLDIFEKSGAERLVLLGDLLYHGPRNGVPEGYDPARVAELLSRHGERILAVRGNCDAEIDQMLLPFPMMGDYCTMFEHGRMFFITHGHVYNEQQMPPCVPGTVLIHGHTHLLTAHNAPFGVVLNPGSVALPKGGNPRSYMLYEDGLFRILPMEGAGELGRMAI